MKNVRWGVIGAGGIATRRTIPEGLLRAPNATLVAVQNRSRASEIGAAFGVKATDEIDTLLRLPLDAVYIATPVDFHAIHVEQTARAGKHVLCEKPLGLDVDQARQMVEVCRSQGVKFGTGLMMRFHGAHESAREMIATGRLGEVTFARAQLSCWYPPAAGAWRQDPARSGGGALSDLGTHCLDLLEMLAGPIARVSCQVARRLHDYAVEDSAVVSLTFANGALGAVDCAFNVPDEACVNRLEIYGSNGSLLAEQTIGQGAGGTLVWRRRRDAAGAYDAQQARSQLDNVAIVLQSPQINPYAAQIESFSQAVLDGRDPAVSGAIGLRAQQLLAACYTSAREGRVVDPASM